ncbi:MAG TPA: polysaccharide pyruvyl transferase family protein [Amycolatopsis sp.]|uniref:polysaccharide pyruvyl transferase family protein n=1 Tax=Amycolatopsis sp. TaxID=37632 RepID=UPI002B46AAF3|nr:polysaccharide pyruvyl transferase family protein [Amycolatopsis sp.]HKS49576.1 polysaccharide pyruvyl transferase family protein [Amycolatopsis sp.]
MTLRVGLFGLLGSGNLGNDGSLESVLDFLEERYPDAIVDFMCMGPDKVRERYGLPAVSLHWYYGKERSGSRLATIALKTLGKGVDAVRTALWVRRHDVVIVPGMGVLEASLPLRAWGFPYALLLLCATGRIFRTRVALVVVGSNVIKKRFTRLMFTSAARLAYYRSYRDTLSKDSLRRMGVDTSRDEVYPDLVFSLPVPPSGSDSSGKVGVGVMAYYGSNDDRARAEKIHTRYLAEIKRFVRWLVDQGREVRLFTGDDVDQSVVSEILADVRSYRPDLRTDRVTAPRVSSLDDLMREMSAVETVVATRYHNVLCALKLAKPTVSLGYARKNEVLMADMGLAEFCQSADALDFDRLVEQFTALEREREKLTRTMAERNQANARELRRQFDVLSEVIS